MCKISSTQNFEILLNLLTSPFGRHFLHFQTNKTMLSQLQRLTCVKFTRCLNNRSNYDHKIESTNTRYRGLFPPTSRGNSVPNCWDFSMNSSDGGFSLIKAPFKYISLYIGNMQGLLFKSHFNVLNVKLNASPKNNTSDLHPRSSFY